MPVGYRGKKNVFEIVAHRRRDQRQNENISGISSIQRHCSSYYYSNGSVQDAVSFTLPCR